MKKFVKSSKNKKLKIAQISPLWFSIPPKKYGGIEKVVFYLTEGLIKRGHKVTLFASGDSKTSAKLISVTKKNLYSRKIPWEDWLWHGLSFCLATKMAKNFDIIHSHLPLFGFFFQNFTKTKVLHTFHNLPSKKDYCWQVLKNFKNSNVVFVSRKEKKNSPLRFKREFVVYNGIDVKKFKFNPKAKDHFIWIGRFSPKKGPKNAILIAKKLKIKLLLAGQIQKIHEEFFEREIKPNLDEKIKYIGELDQKKLPSFYGKAKAFIYPLEWEEPFGLCPIEAMACGTPVIAFNLGSMPEIIKNGKTGFVVPFLKKGKKNFEGIIEAIKKIDKIKREDCRKWVEENFTFEKMVENYEKIYYKLIK